MKTAISVPDAIFYEVEQCASDLGISRSEVYSRAAADFVKARRTKSITEQLNRVYADESLSALDPVLVEMQVRTLGKPREW
jgi:metal-responsive CopG/Arc/MetJ family transcriptional regulator